MLHSVQAMSTRWEIVLPPQGGHSEESLRAAAEQAAQEIQYWDERLSLFRKQSLVSYINLIAHVRPVKLDEREWSLFSLARDIWQQSTGAFDITVAPAMKSLGLHDDSSTAQSSTVHGSEHLILDPAARTISFDSPGIGIDLGAVAKGFALDQIAELLRELNITSAFLHAGTSSTLAIGLRPDGHAWRVSLGADQAAPVVELSNQSLSVSALRTRPAELAPDSNRLHILDPRAIDHGISGDLDTVAVVHRSGAFAEAWSTATLVSGSKHFPPDISLAAKNKNGAWTTHNLNRAAVPASLGV